MGVKRYLRYIKSLTISIVVLVGADYISSSVTIIQRRKMAVILPSLFSIGFELTKYHVP